MMTSFSLNSFFLFLPWDETEKELRKVSVFYTHRKRNFAVFNYAFYFAKLNSTFYTLNLSLTFFFNMKQVRNRFLSFYFRKFHEKTEKRSPRKRGEIKGKTTFNFVTIWYNFAFRFFSSKKVCSFFSARWMSCDKSVNDLFYSGGNICHSTLNTKSTKQKLKIP